MSAHEHTPHTDPSGPHPAAAVRRRLTLLFTDVAGSTRLGRVLEPEDYAAIMEGVRGVWKSAAERYGGRIVRTQGDGALMLFGLPQVHEDDGRRAVDAALDIHEGVRRLDCPGLRDGFAPLSMHSGIHAGTLLLAPGDIERGRFDLTGDIANTAAHLSNAAKAGEIIASLHALGPHANFFELIQPPHGLAGLPAQEVRVVVRRSGVRRRFDATARRGLTPFIGRDAVFRRIHDFLAPPGDGPTPASRCLVVVGEAGIGKTRLLEELVRGADTGKALVLQGGCERDIGAEVLQPFAQMIRSHFGLSARIRTAEITPALREALRPWQEQLGAAADALLHLLVTDSEAGAGRATTGGVVGDLLTFCLALRAKQPIVMLIDDWQWADDASRQLLDALLRGSAGPRIILATRPRDEAGIEVQGAQHLLLAPLSEAQTRQAIRRWLPYADPFLCAQIHEYSGGIPLFIEELCHSASVGALARAIEGRDAARNWIAGLAVARLERTPPQLAQLVRKAAVIGNEVPLWLLASIEGHDVAAGELAALSEADFLHPGDAAGVLRFKHGITRDAIYHSIGLRERTALHESVLSALMEAAHATAQENVEALAHHSRGAGRWEDAARFAESAGDKAMSAFALDRARVLYELAMDALDRIGRRSREQALQWCHVSNKLGMTCVFDPLPLGGDASIFERTVEVAAELGDVDAVARARYWLAYICYGMGRFRDSVRHTREALALARQAQDSRLAVQIEATLGQVLAATGNYAEAIELIDVAVDAKRQRKRPRGGLAIGSAYALAVKGGLLADRGDFPAAHACHAEAIDLLEGSTHPVGNSVRNWIAVAHNWQGNWAQAARVAADSLRIAENTRALLLLSAARSSLGYAQWASDGSAAGLDQLNEAMRWMDERQGRFYTSIYFGWLVAACVAEGRTQEARGHALKVLQRARQGERLGEAVACRGMAWLAVEKGDEPGAARWLRRAEAAAQRRESAREAALNQWVRGQILLRLERPHEGRPLLEQAAAAFDAMGMAWHAQAARRQGAGAAPRRPLIT